MYKWFLVRLRLFAPAPVLEEVIYSDMVGDGLVTTCFFIYDANGGSVEPIKYVERR